MRSNNHRLLKTSKYLVNDFGAEMIEESASVPREFALQISLFHVSHFDLPKSFGDEILDGAIPFYHESQRGKLTTGYIRIWTNENVGTQDLFRAFIFHN